jgi:hypothetical protein
LCKVTERYDYRSAYLTSKAQKKSDTKSWLTVM